MSDNFDCLVLRVTQSMLAKETHIKETNMGFGKESEPIPNTIVPARRDTQTRFPEKISELKFDELALSQMWVLGDFMGVRSNMGAVARDRSAVLRILQEACRLHATRAQFGYDVIVRGLEPDNKEVLQSATAAGHDATKISVMVKDIAKVLEANNAKALLDIIRNSHHGLERAVGLLEERLKKTTSEHKAAMLASMSNYVESMESKMSAMALKALADAAAKAVPIVIKTKEKTRKIKGVLPPEFKLMLELASARIPILLVGPSGCGKTYLCGKLAEALDMEFSDQSCSEGMSESVFNGRLLPLGANGAFVHVPSPYMVRYESGGVMLLDEIDAGDSNLFTYTNKSVGNDCYTVEQRHRNPRVVKSKDFVLVAAANTYGHGADAMYVGRNQLDAATLDRFRVGLITMDYSKEVEQTLAPPELLEWAWKLREKILNQRLKRFMSTRVIENLGIMTRMYDWTRAEWERAFFAGWSDAEKKMVTT